jgi:hypothetical protein
MRTTTPGRTALLTFSLVTAGHADERNGRKLALRALWSDEREYLPVIA